MKLSLLNTLSDGRGGGINPDGLSLDLQFAADKTFSKPSSLAAGETAITSRRGPSATFLRSTAATEVGPDGLIRYAPENLLTKSEEFNDAAWSRAAVGVAAATITPNSDIAPDGTTTADTANFSATTATNQQGMLFRNALTATIGQVVTFSVYMRVPSGTATVFIVLSEGAPLSGQSVACNVTTTWQRFSVTRTALAAAGIFTELGPDTRPVMGQPAVQPAASVFLWGAQVERHTSARAYIPTTTAAVYGPRFDHDPVTLACKGLLIEEGRTNLSVRSEELSDAAYSRQGLLPVISNVSTAPDGNTSADRIVEDTSYGVHRLSTPNFNITTGTTYTASVFAKSDGRRYLYMNAGYGFNAGSTFDLQNGVISGVGIGSSAITKLNNGWYRCAITGTATKTVASGVALQINNTVSIGFDDFYTGDGTSGLLLWGAQIEAGSFPTSYIPTTTGTLARSADVCNITGANFTSFYNQSEGAFFTEFLYRLDSLARPIHISDGTSAGNVAEVFSGSGISSNVFSGSAQQYTREISATNNTSAKTALAIAASNAMLCVNGALATAGGGLMPVGVNRMIIGNRADGARNLNGHIASVRYYRKRLPNAKLVTLTT
jgi:hypothetical protein